MIDRLFLVALFVELGEKVIGQQRNIFFTLPKWWNRQVDHLEAVIEIFAKHAFFDHLLEFTIRRSQDSHADPLGRSRTHRSEGPLLQDTQHFNLHRHRGLTDLIKKERTAIGFFKEPLLVANGSGEGALHMTK